MFNDTLQQAHPMWMISMPEISWVQGVHALIYLLCAWLCLVCAIASRQAGESVTGWFVAVACLLGMMVESIFDVHLYALGVFRHQAYAEGWYGMRREIQTWFLGFSLLTGMALLAWLRTRIAEDWPDCALAVFGLGLLLCLLLLRTVSLHDIDSVLNFALSGVSTASVIELIGLGLVIAGTRRWLQTR